MFDAFPAPVTMEDGQTLWATAIALFQPRQLQNQWCFSLSTSRYGGDKLGHFFCEQTPTGQWMAVQPVAHLTGNVLHPDLNAIEMDYILKAREVIEKIGPSCLEVIFLAETDEDGCIIPKTDATFYNLNVTTGGKTTCVSQFLLDMIPGVRGLERRAELFWPTLGLQHEDYSATSGHYTLIITKDGFRLAINEWQAEFSFESQFVDDVWIHHTVLAAPLDLPTQKDLSTTEMFEAGCGKSHLFHGILGHLPIRNSEIDTIHEDDDKRTVFQIRPGTFSSYLKQEPA